MAKPFTCNTRSPAGNMILGVLFLGCALLLIAAPCIALAGTAVGSVTPPQDFHDLLGTLCVLGVSLAMMAATLALGVLCLNASLLPKTLEINDEGIELRWFKKRLGMIPFANVKDVFVKTRAMAGQSAEGAFWQASLRGGLIGGLIAQSRFDPNESIGFVIRLADSNDPDTFWPKGIFGKQQKKRLEVHYYWRLPHDRLVEKIASAVARHKKRISRSGPVQ
jgi:hypothetical protein